MSNESQSTEARFNQIRAIQGACSTYVIQDGNWIITQYYDAGMISIWLHRNLHTGEIKFFSEQMKVLTPEDTPPAAIETALQQVLAQAVVNPDLLELSAVVASLSAAVAQGPKALMSLLFPAQYQALRTLHQLNQVAEEDQGYDWETLTPTLEAVSKGLNTAGYGTQLSIGDDSADEDLGLIPWTAEILDFLKDYINRTDNLEAEAELVWRLLTISIQLHTRTQLDAYLDTLRARLLDDDDDLKDLSSMPLEDILEQITKPVAA